MCGIAMLIGSWASGERLVQMTNALERRGPDGYGYMLANHDRTFEIAHNRKPTEGGSSRTVGFGHRRLAILDVSDVALQPMTDTDGDYVICFNGEIYNHAELRVELEALGHHFRTRSDTEVLLAAYKQWGANSQSRLVGMWAFAIYDRRKGEVFLSRDRFGIKPLFYMMDNHGLALASEIKAFKAAGFSLTPDFGQIHTFFGSGALDQDDASFFAEIRKFPAGHCATVDIADPSRWQARPYWTLSTDVEKRSEAEWVESYRAQFLDSVRLHARSDVAIGTCLSGGLDSSSIVCGLHALTQSGDAKFSNETFGYVSEDAAYDESRFMDIVANATGVKLNKIHLNDALVEARMLEIIEQNDEPFGSASIIAQSFVFERARSMGIKVMIDGQGADEVLCGYHGYFSIQAHLLRKRGDYIGLMRLLTSYRLRFGTWPISPFHNSFFARCLRKTRDQSAPPDLLSVIADRSKLASGPTTSAYTCLSDRLRADTLQLVLPALLRNEDRTSMMHSVEARVPFLDHRLVELTFHMPDSMKLRGATTKYVLREAMRGILPEPIRNRRDKIGFKSSPSWTFEYARRHLDSLAENQTEPERQLFNPAGVRNVLCELIKNNANEFFLWRIINCKLWLRQNWG